MNGRVFNYSNKNTANRQRFFTEATKNNKRNGFHENYLTAIFSFINFNKPSPPQSVISIQNIHIINIGWNTEFSWWFNMGTFRPPQHTICVTITLFSSVSFSTPYNVVLLNFSHIFETSVYSLFHLSKTKYNFAKKKTHVFKIWFVIIDIGTPCSNYAKGKKKTQNLPLTKSLKNSCYRGEFIEIDSVIHTILRHIWIFSSKFGQTD